MPFSSRIMSMPATWMRTPLGGTMPAAWRWKCSQEVISRRGMTPSLQDLLVAVDVVEVALEGLDPLGDAALQPRPLGGRDDPWDQVQRKRPLLAGQRERDALVAERPAQRLGAGLELGGVRRRELGVNALVRAADIALTVEHLVEGLAVTAGGVVAVEDALVVLRRPRLAARLPPRLDGHSSKGHVAMLHHIRRFCRPSASALGECTPD